MSFGPCAPSPPAAPPIAMTPCQMLAQMQMVLFTLLSGKSRAQGRSDDQRVSYHAGNVKELRAEIQRLEAVCGDATSERGRAVQVGPRRIAGDYVTKERYR